MIWNAVVGEFHSQISKKLTYGDAKAAFEKALDQIDEIQSARQQFKRALILAGVKDYGEDSATPRALSLIEPLWEHAVKNTPSLANSIEMTFRKSFEEVKKKFHKDYRLMEDLPIADDITLWWTNRRVVRHRDSAYPFLYFFRSRPSPF